MGGSALLVRCAEILESRGHAISAVVSRGEAVTGWTRVSGRRHFRRTADAMEMLKTLEFDYLFSIGNFSIVPPALLAMPRIAAINFHDAPLPKYAGSNATSWALIRREASHGVTWHLMTDEVDAGDILKQKMVEVRADDTALQLNARCYEAAVSSFSELLEDIENHRLTPVKQDMSERTYFPRAQQPYPACILPLRAPAEDLDACVRALAFGPSPNGFGVAKICIGGEFAAVTKLEMLAQESAAEPGTVIRVDDDGVIVATSTRNVVLGGFATVDGASLTTKEFVKRYAVRPGRRFDATTAETSAQILSGAASTVLHEDYWVRRLLELRPIQTPYRRDISDAPRESTQIVRKHRLPQAVQTLLDQKTGPDERADYLLAAFGAFLAALSGEEVFDIGYGEPDRRPNFPPSLFAEHVPVRVEANPMEPFGAALAAVGEGARVARRRGSYLRDVALRYPALLSQPPGPLRVAVERVAALPTYRTPSAAELTLIIPDEGSEYGWAHDERALDAAAATAIARQFAAFLQGVASEPHRPLGEQPLLSEDERRKLLIEWNNTRADFPQDACIHELVEGQAARTPDAIAVAFDDEELTYSELNARANRLATHLREMGVGPDVLAGVCMETSIDLPVALLAVLKAGGAYVPMDPSFPRERLAYMVEESRTPVIVTHSHLRAGLPPHQGRVVCLDTEPERLLDGPGHNLPRSSKAENLAYVIFTSGSTGRPKGVMVTHRNVVNFFTGMDTAIGGGAPGVWLAVTTISFDISVLELFWTLARGFKVVLHAKQTAPTVRAQRKIDFSLLYFSGDGYDSGNEKYRILLEGAKFADRHGFAAVWTPERHFHAFGGLYPNPAITSAAVAAVTERIQIRAGSVVLPLHHPVRVAEQWSMVDNLSKGRVGVSFASGWHTHDFILAPENFADRREIMFRGIETVRALWRGEAVMCQTGAGDEAPIKILPRPVQEDLPVWVTASGSPDTFRRAGEIGANLLTHLLGQTIEELREKIEVYREARRSSAYPGEGRVTVMLHTFVGQDVEVVKETIREPFCAYLKTSMDLIAKAASAWDFAPFGDRPGSTPREVHLDPTKLSERDMEALLSHAFNRYFETNALFGTPEMCLEQVERLRSAGADEIACLIDFGVDADTVLAGLNDLNIVRERSNRSVAKTPLAKQLNRHRVTHLQCTPAMARMLLADSETREALSFLEKMMVGGEAMPAPLAHDLIAATPEVINMYGPTETTVWSATHRVIRNGSNVPIGRPIANTEFYILDSRMRPVPIGVAGELFIGGAGVTPGYLNREELTAERFVANPFASDSSARLYRTGDLARYRPDGEIEFLGRVDHQVKIRGYRIELGEIEAVLAQHPEVRECAVTAREDTPGDQRLVAYIIPASSRRPDSATACELQSAEAMEQRLLEHVRQRLPEYMAPAHFVFMEAFPRTPNNKLDRRALPPPEQKATGAAQQSSAPSTPLQRALASIWSEVLGREQIGARDSFFRLGGHSVLATQLVSRVREIFKVDLPLHIVFEQPTIEGQAEALLSGPERVRIEATARLIEKITSLTPEERQSRRSESKQQPVGV